MGARLCHVAADGEDFTPLTDLSGSVVGWIDAAGVVAGERLFDPFGRTLELGGAWPAPFGYRGYWGDDATGLYLLAARAYDPDLGRFLQPDPLGYIDGLNQYAYARHAPALYTDRLGFASTEIDWGTVAWSAATTAGFGIGLGIAAGFAVSAGIVSLPFVAAVGGLFLLGAGLKSFFRRANESFDAGRTDVAGRAALAALGDTVGISGIYEGATGQDAATDRRLGGQERSERLGTGIGSIAAIAAGGRAFRYGGRLGAAAVRSGAINPATFPSISRPSVRNPLVTGRYVTPRGLILDSEMILYRVRRPGQPVRTVVPLRDAAATYWRTRSARAAYVELLERSRGNFPHILRHFYDKPGRVSAAGNPQPHSVFRSSYGGQVVGLLDDAFTNSLNPYSPVAQGVWQANGRWAIAAWGENGEVFGTYLGHPAAYHPVALSDPTYGGDADVYTVIISQTNQRPITAYPGWPTQ
jgi:RHS repeat-associated protein